VVRVVVRREASSSARVGSLMLLLVWEGAVLEMLWEMPWDVSSEVVACSLGGVTAIGAMVVVEVGMFGWMNAWEVVCWKKRTRLATDSKRLKRIVNCFF
jgi:hypothetical protein